MRTHSCGSVVFFTILSVATVACSKTDAVSNASTRTSATAASPTPSSGTSFELVTVERPESVEAYHKLYKANYEMCAATRKALKMPPPAPMKQAPADYIISRTTHAGDGKAYLVKEEYFTFKVTMEEPAFTCETYLETTSNTQLVRDGKVYNADVDEKGKRSSQPPEEWILPRERKADVYTEAKTVKGIAVKCMHMLPNTEELITELCIADLKPGTLTDLTGRPLTVSSRVTSVQKLQGAIVTEPVSMKVGQAIDKKVFDAAAAP